MKLAPPDLEALPSQFRPPAPPDLSASADPYAALSAGIAGIHHALLGSLEAVVAAADAGRLEVAVAQALAAGGFLLGHHSAEDTVLFPLLRRGSRLRSADVSVLDACDAAHREIHQLCDRLIANANAAHPSAAEIGAVARSTRSVLSAHVVEEEAGLAAERLRSMIDSSGLQELERELAKLRR